MKRDRKLEYIELLDRILDLMVQKEPYMEKLLTDVDDDDRKTCLYHIGEWERLGKMRRKRLKELK